MLSAAPTVAHPISVSGGSTITGKTASLSVLGSDAAGAAKLVYDWSITSAPTGGGATFSTNASNAAANTALTFTKAGSYGISVKIVDPSGLSVTNSLAVSVTAVLTSIKISTPSNTVLNSGATLQVSGPSQSLAAQGLDQFGNALATQPALKWSTFTVSSGAAAPALSSSGTTETFTFSKVGSYGESVQATAAGGAAITGKATLQVVAKPSYITVAHVGGTAPITGTTTQFTVSQFQDQFHNPISEASTITWAATTIPSGAATPTFSSSAGTSTVTFKAAGQYTLTVKEADSAGNSVSQAVSVTIAQQATGFARPSTTAASVSGTSESLSIPKVVDQFGNAMAAQPSVTWSATALPSGAAAPSFTTSGTTTTVTFAMAGAYTLTAKDASATTISLAFTATVTSTLTSIVVTPNTASVSAGATQQFAAQGLDQFKHAISTQPTFTWSASGGTISSSGLFTAPSSAASDTITAKNGSVTGIAAVSVTAQSNFLNLQNATLAQLVKSLDADGSISRNDMIQILDSVSAKGAVTASELADLKAIVNTDATALNMPGYVQVLAGDVVDGNAANATYLGKSLGNLASGSSATQLNDLIGEWFLGTNLPTLTDPSLVYKTVAGSLFPTTPSHANEFQGELGDCYFISSLGTIADKDPAAIEDMFINNGDGTYTVRFYTGNYGSSYNSSNGSYSDGFSSGSGTADYVTVNSSLPTTAGGMLVYADYGASATNANNSLWIPLAEKAYAQWNQTGKEGRSGQDSFAAIEGGWMATVDAQVLGHNATDYMMGTATQQQLVSALASGQSVTIGTNQADMYGLYGSHAYAVTAYNATSNTFTLYNPWGFDQPGQLTWSQLTTACEGFVAVNAAGATAISGAVLKAGSIGYFASSSVNPAPAAADAGPSSAAASDQWFASGGNVSAADDVPGGAAQTSPTNGNQAPMAGSNSVGDTDNGESTTDVVVGGATSPAVGASSSLQSLAIASFNTGNATDQGAAPADSFYAELGSA